MLNVLFFNKKNEDKNYNLRFKYTERLCFHVEFFYNLNLNIILKEVQISIFMCFFFLRIFIDYQKKKTFEAINYRFLTHPMS